MSGTGDYISRKAAIEAVCKCCLANGNCGHTCKEITVLQSIPAADVRPVVRGKWKLGGYGQISDATEKWYDKYLTGGFLYCSVCKGRTSAKFNFCPNCGAWMEES